MFDPDTGTIDPGSLLSDVQAVVQDFSSILSLTADALPLLPLLTKKLEVFQVVELEDFEDATKSLPPLIPLLRNLDSSMQRLSLQIHNLTQRFVNICRRSGTVGVHSLPDEIISAILDIALADECEETESPVHLLAIKYSHVSGRFRGVLTNAPSYWTTLESSLPLSMVDAFLQWSAQRPLKVCLESLPNGPSESFLYLARQHSARWSSLELQDAHAYSAIRRVCTALNLESLNTLYMGAQWDVSIPEGWSTPNLTHVAVKEGMDYPLRPTVTSCTAHFTEASPHISDVMRNVAKSQALTTLCLKFKHCDFDDMWIDGSSFRNLRELSFEIWSDGRFNSFPDFEEIPLPNLEVLKIYVQTLDDHDSFYTFATAWATEGPVYPKLLELHIIYDCMEDPDEDEDEDEAEPVSVDFLDQILKKTPLLQKLSLDGDFIFPPGWRAFENQADADSFAHISTLRHIEFGDVALISHAYLHGFLKSLQSSPSWPTFEGLTIARFPDWDSKDALLWLEDAAQGKTITWIEADMSRARDHKAW